MTPDTLQRHWTLVAAIAIMIPVGIAVVGQFLSQTRKGKLKSKASVLKAARKQRSACVKKVEVLGEKLNVLMEQSDRVRPTRIDGAKVALSEAISEAKTADDQRLIAETQLRQFILDEFAPDRQEALQKRFLLQKPG